MGKPLELGRAGVKKVTVGAGGLVIAVPVVGESPETVAREWDEAVSRGADIVEWRRDRMDPNAAPPSGAALREKGQIPVLFTVRRDVEGGSFDGSLSEYRMLLAEAAQWADAVDVEIASPDAADLIAGIHRRGALAVGSKHVLSGAVDPGKVRAELQKIAAAGADIAKLAWAVTDDHEAAQIEDLQVWAENNLAIPAVLIGMGEPGTRTRLGEAARRSAFTFAIAAAGSAPGQVSIEDVRASN